MIFENINESTLLLSILLLWIWALFSWKNYFKNKNILLIIIFQLALISIIISLFSPRYWDYSKMINIEWWKITFVLDVSKSMDVYDILYNWRNTTRLEAQKWIISQYITNNTNNQYSLFAFAAEILEILPFTSDIWLFQTILVWVDKNNVSKYGSEFIWLFQTLSDFVENEDNAGTIVIFTDGWEESEISLKQSILQKIDTHNSKVIIIWLWTESGWYIIEGQDLFGRALYKTYRWEKVISKLNNKVLHKFSNKYNFDYYSINNLDNMEGLYKSITDKVNQKSIEKNISLKRDISDIFMSLFIVLFITFLIFENIIWRQK
jgi:hypothetical protein